MLKHHFRRGLIEKAGSGAFVGGRQTSGGSRADLESEVEAGKVGEGQFGLRVSAQFKQ